MSNHPKYHHHDLLRVSPRETVRANARSSGIALGRRVQKATWLTDSDDGLSQQRLSKSWAERFIGSFPYSPSEICRMQALQYRKVVARFTFDTDKRGLPRRL
jgi:hypothetical protein